VTGNPLRSEAAAFQWVLGTVVVLALVVAASWISTWLGLAVVVLLAALAAWHVATRRRHRPPQPPEERAAVDDTPEP
jgi:Flp pilus assembly protein TadB